MDTCARISQMGIATSAYADVGRSTSPSPTFAEILPDYYTLIITCELVCVAIPTENMTYSYHRGSSIDVTALHGDITKLYFFFKFSFETTICLEKLI